MNKLQCPVCRRGMNKVKSSIKKCIQTNAEKYRAEQLEEERNARYEYLQNNMGGRYFLGSGPIGTGTSFSDSTPQLSELPVIRVEELLASLGRDMPSSSTFTFDMPANSTSLMDILSMASSQLRSSMAVPNLSNNPLGIGGAAPQRFEEESISSSTTSVTIRNLSHYRSSRPLGARGDREAKLAIAFIESVFRPVIFSSSVLSEINVTFPRYPAQLHNYELFNLLVEEAFRLIRRHFLRMVEEGMLDDVDLEAANVCSCLECRINRGEINDDGTELATLSANEGEAETASAEENDGYQSIDDEEKGEYVWYTDE